MPAPLLPKKEVVSRLLRVFRESGYEGATVARMSTATGLVKASLYHYFPEGKEQMAGAVFDAACEWLSENVISPLQGSQPPVKRVGSMLKNLDQFYKGGMDTCIIDVLVQGDARGVFQSKLKPALEAWVAAMAKVAVDSGATPAGATRIAEDALVRLEGAIIVSRALGRNAAFKRALVDIERSLLNRD
jgi:AcrR family transcriptional regulator